MTKQGFEGMTGHWIEVKGGKWKMRSAVIGFKALSGSHTGENFGRYAVGLLDHVGIMDKNGSKACHLPCFRQSTILMSLDSSIQQRSITLGTIIRLAKPSKISTFDKVLSGIAASNNYCMSIR
jgi:hypothetical protein